MIGKRVRMIELVEAVFRSNEYVYGPQNCHPARLLELFGSLFMPTFMCQLLILGSFQYFKAAAFVQTLQK